MLMDFENQKIWGTPPLSFYPLSFHSRGEKGRVGLVGKPYFPNV
jgi:hypothetical protein